eukprot:c12867_g1_i3.p1 GENE.c12867_g1_i3~~c12867_g1_i3.p1  ORF type:complete len:813 (+),score=200.08 c12867_g1_i3:50-2440(+)
MMAWKNKSSPEGGTDQALDDVGKDSLSSWFEVPRPITPPVQPVLLPPTAKQGRRSSTLLNQLSPNNKSLVELISQLQLLDSELDKARFLSKELPSTYRYPCAGVIPILCHFSNTYLRGAVAVAASPCVTDFGNLDAVVVRQAFQNPHLQQKVHECVYEAKSQGAEGRVFFEKTRMRLAIAAIPDYSALFELRAQSRLELPREMMVRLSCLEPLVRALGVLESALESTDPSLPRHKILSILQIINNLLLDEEGPSRCASMHHFHIIPTLIRIISTILSLTTSTNTNKDKDDSDLPLFTDLLTVSPVEASSSPPTSSPLATETKPLAQHTGAWLDRNSSNATPLATKIRINTTEFEGTSSTPLDMREFHDEVGTSETMPQPTPFEEADEEEEEGSDDGERTGPEGELGLENKRLMLYILRTLARLTQTDPQRLELCDTGCVDVLLQIIRKYPDSSLALMAKSIFSKCIQADRPGTQPLICERLCNAYSLPVSSVPVLTKGSEAQQSEAVMAFLELLLRQKICIQLETKQQDETDAIVDELRRRFPESCHILTRGYVALMRLPPALGSSVSPSLSLSSGSLPGIEPTNRSTVKDMAVAETGGANKQTDRQAAGGESDSERGMALLHKSLVLRQTYLPEAHSNPRVSKQLASGHMFWKGYDSAGRPVLFIRPSGLELRHYDREAYLLAHVQILEDGLNLLPLSPSSEATQVVVCVDTKGLTRKHIDFDFLKQLGVLMNDMYPKRIAGVHIGPSNLLVRSAYFILFPFLPAPLREVVHVMKAPQQTLQALGLSAGVPEGWF